MGRPGGRRPPLKPSRKEATGEALLSAHHEAEDKIAFPAFRERLEAPFDQLTEQHRQLHPLLEEAKAEVEKAATEPDAAGPWMRLNLILRRIEEFWHPHIGIEEEHFTVGRFASLMPPDEHRQMNALFMQHTQKHTGPDYLMVPFLLHNLTPDKRLGYTLLHCEPQRRDAL